MQGFLFSLLTMSVACSFMYPRVKENQTTTTHPNGTTIEKRFDPPLGYQRIERGEMTRYCRSLALQNQGAQVHLYNGALKSNQLAHAAVLKFDVGTKDLQQCADACIRLRAEYLWSQKRFDEIHFELTNGWRMAYTEWRKGKRLLVKGNQTNWSADGEIDTSYTCFRKYLDHVFMYAGTLSLQNELKPVAVSDIMIGDVIVQGGSPGHAVMIVDMVKNDAGQRLVMLAQSYMPAQEIHILKNPVDESVWHDLSNTNTLPTAEWTFENFMIGRF